MVILSMIIRAILGAYMNKEYIKCDSLVSHNFAPVLIKSMIQSAYLF